MIVSSILILQSQMNFDHRQSKGSSQQYLKEYSAYHFDFRRNEELKSTHSVVFLDNKFNGNRPGVYLDKNREDESLYLLQWQKELSSIILYVHEFQTKFTTKITMNRLPSNIVIIGNHIYLQGGGLLFILSLRDNFKRIQNLDQAKVISMDPVFTSKRSQGVSVIYFKENKGYFKKQYEVNEHKDTFLNTVIGNVFLTFSKKQEYQYFKVLIPNLIAICFISQFQFILYDLGNMEAISNKIYTLTEWKLFNEPQINYRIHEALPGFNDTLIISISSGNNIEILFLNINKMKEIDPLLPITAIAQGFGRIINWEETCISKYLVFHVDGNVQKHIMTSEGLLYWAKEDEHDKIPFAGFRSFHQSHQECPILTLQTGIRREYLCDQANLKAITLDRLFIPNRYHPNFLEDVLNQSINSIIIKDHKIHKKLQLHWHIYEQFTQFVFYHEVVYIVRRHSMSRMLSIQAEQFQLETQSINNLDDHVAISRNNESVCLSQVSDIINPALFQKQINGERNRPVVMSPNFSNPVSQNQMRKKASVQQCQKYRQLLEKIHKISGYEQISLAKRKRKQNFDERVTKLVAINKLKDQINYWEYVLLNNRPNQFVSMEGEPNRLTAELSKQTLTITLFSNFRRMLYNAHQQVKSYGKDLITLFLENNYSQWIGQIDIDMYNMMGLLWRGLFPRKFVRLFEEKEVYPNGKDYDENAFLGFLTDLGYFETLPPHQIEMVRFISILFASNTIIYPPLFNNLSVLRCLLAVHPILEKGFTKRILSRYLLQKDTRVLKELEEKNQGEGRSVLQEVILMNQQFGKKQFQQEMFNLNNSLQVDERYEDQRYIQRSILQKLIIQLKSKASLTTHSAPPISKLLKKCQIFLASSDDTQTIQHENLKEEYKVLMKKCNSHNHLQRILEIQQIMLRTFSKKFNSKCSRFGLYKQKGTQMDHKYILFTYWYQLSTSLGIYKRKFKQLYSAYLEPFADQYTQMKDPRIQDERLMTSNMLDQWIIVANKICTSTWLNCLKKCFIDGGIADRELIKLEDEAKLFNQFDSFHEEENLRYQMLKDVLKNIAHDSQEQANLDTLLRNYTAAALKISKDSNSEMTELFSLLHPNKKALFGYEDVNYQKVKEYLSYRNQHIEALLIG